MSVAVAPPAEAQRVRFRVDTGATKTATAPDGSVELRGYASTWNEDRDGEVVDKSAFDGSWEDYIGKNPMLLYQHNPDWPLGSITEGGKDKSGLAVAANVPKPPEGSIPELITAYHGIERGFLKTFSIGGFMEKALRAGKRVITKVELLEISVVSIPANPDSVFVAASKALAGEPMAELSPKARAQMEQLLGFQPLNDPELKAMSDEQVDDHWSALTDLFQSTYGVEPPPRDAWTKVLRARAGGVAVPIVAKASLEVVRAFYQPEAPSLQAVEEKAGRKLSRENENKLRKARHHIDSVLIAVAPRAPDEDNDDDSKEPGAPLDAAAPASMGYSASQAKARDAKTYRDLEAALRSAIAETMPSDDDELGYCCLEDFSDDWAVYYNRGQLYRVSYSRDDSGEITLGEPEEVRQVTSYVAAATQGARSVEFDHEGNPFIDMGTKGALPVRGLAIADRDRAWDAGGARDRVKDWSDSADAPNAKYGQAFLYRDGDGSNFGDYKFIVADVIDGTLTYIPKAIFAAAAVVQGGRGGTSDEVATAIKPKLTTLYGKLRAKFKDDTLTPPWSGD